jgi:hypothetical protein
MSYDHELLKLWLNYDSWILSHVSRHSFIY